jgi:cyclomaltodextrinase
LFAINNDEQTQRVNFATPGLHSTPSHLLYGDAQISWQVVEEQNYLELTIPARSGLIIG